MLALIQRVANARVRLPDDEVVGEIGAGLLVLLCAMRGDTEREADRMVERVLKLRIFADAAGKMNRSVQDIAGGLLVVSQFTLAADPARGGNRPGFSDAAVPADALRLYEHFLNRVRKLHGPVEAGRFGAHMQVELVNDGPVTIRLEVEPDRQ